MTAYPEQEKSIETPQAPEEIERRAEQMEVSETIQKTTGAKPTKTQATAQITDDQGKKLIQTPQDQTVNIQLPNDQTTLASQAKGDPSNALTGFAQFWLRMLKKAKHFGWKTFFGGKK